MITTTPVRHFNHMTDERPWPIINSLAGLGVTMGLVSVFHVNRWNLSNLAIVTLIMVSFSWWRDISREGTYQGFHTKIVETGLKWGIILFITSEVFFFVSFFWAFFHSRLSPSIELGSRWPPAGINPFNPWGVPLLNTIILISSGIRLTWCHRAVETRLHRLSVISLAVTGVLGIYFTVFQGIEYNEAPFSISDSIYGSTFFIATGFHGLHVMIGSAFLFICLLRILMGRLRETHHVGLKSSIWYWHFVDIVWLFLFFWVYMWGAAKIKWE